jgi:hypothetical protein
MVKTLNDDWVEMSVAEDCSPIIQSLIIAQRKSLKEGSSKTSRISIKESLDKALVQLSRDGDEENEYYSSSSGKLVVDCSKIKDLNNARWTMLC